MMTAEEPPRASSSHVDVGCGSTVGSVVRDASPSALSARAFSNRAFSASAFLKTDADKSPLNQNRIVQAVNICLL